jgi:serine/threonine protein phosphatase 1
MPKRTIAVGDIHGCSKALDALIEAIRPTPDDEIVMLGDYVDRGPDSRGVLDRLIALESRCKLIPLLGNHDQMILDALNGEDPEFWLAVGGLQALESYGPERSLETIPGQHIAFLERCRDFYETDSHIFVHANYYPDIPMDEQCVAMLRWESLKSFTPGPHDSGKTVIVGHSSQKSGEIRNLGHLVCIDTFCYGGGWLTALEVHTGRAWQADREGTMRDRHR